MVNLLSNIADEYFARKLAQRIEIDLKYYYLNVLSRIKNKHLEIFVKKKKEDEYNLIFYCNVDECLYLLITDSYKNLLLLIKDEIERKIK